MNKAFLLTIGTFLLLASLVQVYSLLNGLELNWVRSATIDRSKIQATESAKIKQEEPKQPEAEKEYVPENIEISKVSINLPILSMPIKNGTWDVKEGVANFALGTSMVSKKSGNTGLFGHDKLDSFHRIKDLTVGDSVLVSGKGYLATYQVYLSSVVSPTAIEVFKPGDKPELTLVTCDGAFSSQRYVVKAALVRIEENYEKTI